MLFEIENRGANGPNPSCPGQTFELLFQARSQSSREEFVESLDVVSSKRIQSRR